MALAELIDERKELFRRPKAIKEIMLGEQPIEVTRPEELLLAAQYRGTKPLLIHGFDLIPPCYYSAANFGKRGPLVELPTFEGNARKLIDNRWSELHARIKACETYRNSKKQFVGWTWADPEGRHHVLRPTTSFEGHRLHMYSLQATSIEDKIEVKKEYGAHDSSAKTVSVLVPSRSNKQKYEILVQHVTDANDPARFAEWTRLDTNHFCPQKTFDRVTFRFADRGGVVNYCPHDIAAHVAYSRKIGEEKKRIIPQPFPLMTEPFVRLAITLLHHTAKVDIDTKAGKVRTHTRPLTYQEADTVLMDAWKTFDNRYTLFVESPTKAYKRGAPLAERKTMRQYDWSINGPGMPFRHD